MHDLKEVIYACECAFFAPNPTCDNCPYFVPDEDNPDTGSCDRNSIYMDIYNLLKAQEPREPHFTELVYNVKDTQISIDHPECPRCIENGLAIWDAGIERGAAFCKRCGQAVKWND